jgi:signal transduction histidine kinase
MADGRDVEGPPRPRGGWAAPGATLAAAVLGVALLHAALDPRPESLLRHAYVAPVVMAALRFGAAGGALAALAPLLLETPALFAATEREGLTAAVGEAGLTYLELLVVGPALGAVTAEGRRQRQRYELVRDVQHVLAGSLALDEAVHRLRGTLQSRLAAEVAIVARDGDRLIVAGGDALEAASPAAVALHGGIAVFVADAGGGARPRRSLSVPLAAGGACVGALVVERDAGLGAAERRVLAELGVSLGLALENARLTSRQRRFAQELAEKVSEATRRLEELDRAKSAFVATASHELRTPLTALLGFSELLATRPFDGREVHRLAEIMRRETERLARLVDDLLDLSRLERGLPLRLAPSALAVGAAVLAAVEVFRRGRPTHRIVAECGEPLPLVRADADALDRIVKNLVSNAIKYSPAGSQVRVRVQARGALVEIAVEDEGRGIAPEARARVFEPYYRTPEAAASAPGTGLGLAVVKSLVEAHGGTIQLDSAPGAGTRIAVQLPALP